MTTISCQLKRIRRQSALLQRWWKWIQRMLKDCKWLSWTIFEQVKTEIDLKKINQTAAMRTLLDEERK